MIICFIVSLVIITIVHEAAHLIVAKKCKCGVIRYSIGFGKPVLLSKKIGNTIYQLTPWLFGGYCELKGELKATKVKNAFINLPYRKKLAIAIAGCAINIISGAIIMYIGLRFQIYNLYYFGYLSLALGVTNWFIPIPCLDGGYALWYPILIRKYGIKKGTKIFAKAVRISFILVIILNIVCIPYLIYLFKTGRV